jgi:biopolymer transport protein ExbD
MVTVPRAPDGSVSVDGRTLSTADLTALLAKRPDPAHTVVTIAGAKDAQLQKLMNVMDACRAAGVTQVSLAAQPEKVD